MEDFFLSWHVNKKDERVILHLCRKCAHVMVNFRVVHVWVGSGQVVTHNYIHPICGTHELDHLKKKFGPEQAR